VTALACYPQASSDVFGGCTAPLGGLFPSKEDSLAEVSAVLDFPSLEEPAGVRIVGDVMGKTG